MQRLCSSLHTLTKGSGVQQCRLAWPPCIIVAYPLLTALARHPHMPGLSTPEAWGPGAEAQRCAAHCAVNARAVVPAVGLEGLAIGVAHAIQDAAHTDHLCKHRWWTCQARRGGLCAKILLCIFPLPKMPCQEITHVRKEGLCYISAGCTPRAKSGTRERWYTAGRKGTVKVLATEDSARCWMGGSSSIVQELRHFFCPTLSPAPGLVLINACPREKGIHRKTEPRCKLGCLPQY